MRSRQTRIVFLLMDLSERFLFLGYHSACLNTVWHIVVLMLRLRRSLCLNFFVFPGLNHMRFAISKSIDFLPAAETGDGLRKLLSVELL